MPAVARKNVAPEVALEQGRRQSVLDAASVVRWRRQSVLVMLMAPFVTALEAAPPAMTHAVACESVASVWARDKKRVSKRIHG